MLNLQELVKEWIELQEEVKLTIEKGDGITLEQRRRSINIQDKLLCFPYYEVDKEKEKQKSIRES